MRSFSKNSLNDNANEEILNRDIIDMRQKQQIITIIKNSEQCSVSQTPRLNKLRSRNLLLTHTSLPNSQVVKSSRVANSTMMNDLRRSQRLNN